MRDPMRRYRQKLLLFISIVLYGRPINACIGGSGGGGAACCPATSTACAPSVPVCSGSSYGGYSSYSAGGSYAAPQVSYPRPCSSGGCGPAPAPCASSSAGGCGGGGPQISIVAPAPIPQPVYPSVPVGGYAQSVQPIGPSYSAPLPPLPPPAPAPSSYGGNIPQPAPGPEIDSNYEENNQQNLAPPAPNYGDQPPQPPPVEPSNYNEQSPVPPPPPDYTASEGKQNYDNTAVSEAPIPQAKSIYENQHDYADETNTLGGSEPASVAPASTPTDESAAALNCEDAELRKIVEASLQQSGDNLDAARKIESEAAARFGGRFNSIVSNSEFAYVNWYGKRNCQLRVNDRHSLTWED